MKVLKIIAIIAAIYVGIVVVFESLIGYFQPQNETTLVLTTWDDKGEHDRVLTLIEYNNAKYVAVNHWPRGWYMRAKINPDVKATINGETAEYTAIPVTDDGEYSALQAERPQSLVFRFLIGFAPREFMRLEPVPVEVEMAEPVTYAMPIELEDPIEIAAVKILNDSIDAMSESVMSCIEGGGDVSSCQCSDSETLQAVQDAFTQTLDQFPQWQDQSLLWWKDETKSYSYNLNMPGLAKQLEQKCP